VNLLRLDQVAERLGVSVATVRRRIASGELVAYRDGTRIVRVREPDLDRHISERCAATPVRAGISTITAPGRALPPGVRLWDEP
jgi:excisionase family DNA binding protein